MNPNINIVNKGGTVRTFGDFEDINVKVTNVGAGSYSEDYDHETTQDIMRAIQSGQLRGTQHLGNSLQKYLQG